MERTYTQEELEKKLKEARNSAAFEERVLKSFDRVFERLDRIDSTLDQKAEKTEFQAWELRFQTTEKKQDTLEKQHEDDNKNISLELKKIYGTLRYGAGIVTVVAAVAPFIWEFIQLRL